MGEGQARHRELRVDQWGWPGSRTLPVDLLPLNLLLGLEVGRVCEWEK